MGHFTFRDCSVGLKLYQPMEPVQKWAMNPPMASSHRDGDDEPIDLRAPNYQTNLNILRKRISKTTQLLLNLRF